MSAIEMAGQRFGRLVVLARAGSRNAQATWLCRCDCGQEVTVSSGPLRSGRQVSCGCRQREARSERKGRRRVETPTYLGAHYRVHAERGRASEHTCPCGAPAAQWAYDHADPEELTEARINQGGRRRVMRYSAKPEHYVAMCVPCHVRWDRERAA